jgi:hypothetical protein
MGVESGEREDGSSDESKYVCSFQWLWRKVKVDSRLARDGQKVPVRARDRSKRERIVAGLDEFL